MRAVVVSAVLLLSVGCGGAGRVSSYTAVNAACIQQERDIVEREGTSALQDQAALDEVRSACDRLLLAIEGSR